MSTGNSSSGSGSNTPEGTEVELSDCTVQFWENGNMVVNSETKGVKVTIQVRRGHFLFKCDEVPDLYKCFGKPFICFSVNGRKITIIILLEANLDTATMNTKVIKITSETSNITSFTKYAADNCFNNIPSALMNS